MLKAPPEIVVSLRKDEVPVKVNKATWALSRNVPAELFTYPEKTGLANVIVKAVSLAILLITTLSVAYLLVATAITVYVDPLVNPVKAFELDAATVAESTKVPALYKDNFPATLSVGVIE
jgi:hypothetical protein